MAKGKRAAALFEVIHSGKLEMRSGALNTPKWWFKRRPSPSQTTDANSTNLAEPNVDSTSSSAPTLAPGVDVVLDRDRHQITFKITYASATVTGLPLLFRF